MSQAMLSLSDPQAVKKSSAGVEKYRQTAYSQNAMDSSVADRLREVEE